MAVRAHNTYGSVREADMPKRLEAGERRQRLPPDGGWGWMVVLGVAVSNAFAQSQLSVYGLLFADILHEMGLATTGAAFILNFMTATTNFSGLVTGPILKRFSYRKVAVTGVLLVAVGMMLTSRATSMWEMIITYSFLVGLGLGLIAPATFVVVNSYFTTSRGSAVGLSLAGTGVGQMLMPHAVRAFLDEYDFRGTALLLGALALHGLPAAMLFHPVRWHTRRPPPEEQLLPLEKSPPVSPARRNPSIVSLRNLDGPVVVVRKSTSADGDSPLKSLTCWERLVMIFDLDLLRDPVFVSLLLGLAAVYTAGINFGMLFPFFLTDVGLTRSETAMCMSLLAGGDIACRLLLPPLTDWKKVPSRVTFLVGALCLAGIRTLLAMQSDFYWLLIISFACGFARGSTVVNLNLSISESCKEEKLPAALGINMVLKGIFILLFGPLIGWIRDETDSYPMCINILSLFIVIPMGVWLLEMIISRWKGS